MIIGQSHQSLDTFLGVKCLLAFTSTKALFAFIGSSCVCSDQLKEFSGELKIVLLNPLATNSFQREKFMLSVSAYNYSVFVVVLEESDSDFRHFGISRLSRPSKKKQQNL